MLDPRRQAGFFLGFEWSGTWRIVAEHLPSPGALSVSVRTDATVHTIEPGARLESPAAFLGLFSGDWDDGFNACRRYVGSEVIPAPPEGFPPVRYNIGTPRLPRFTPSFLKAGIDAAAEAGVENLTIDAMRWDASADDGDFSIGLGDFADSRKKFPAGLRAVSDLVHERGIRQGKVGCRGWPHARSSHSR